MDDIHTAGPATAVHASVALERQCVLVPAMHRSGSSAVTRIVSLLGADLPSALMNPSKDNPKGYWESYELAALHDRLLEAGGSRWDDWERFPRAEHATEFSQAALPRIGRILERDFNESTLFTIKDPRICRFVPIWLEALRQFATQPHAVIPLRHPFEVADSLRARDGFPLAKACLLWLRHVIEAELATRHIPRVILNYETLVTDWRSEIGKLVECLGVSWPRSLEEAAPSISKFLSAELRHFVSTPQELDVRLDVVSWVRRTYEALLRLAMVGESEATYCELDQIHSEFDNACQAFSALSRLGTRDLANSVFEQVQQADSRIDQLRQDLAAARTEIDQLRRAHGEALARIDGLQAELTEGHRKLDQQCQELDQQHRKLDERNRELDQGHRELAEGHSQLAAGHSQLAEAHSRFNERQQKSLSEQVRRGIRKLGPVTKPVGQIMRTGRDVSLGLVRFRWMRISRHDLGLPSFRRRRRLARLSDQQAAQETIASPVSRITLPRQAETTFEFEQHPQVSDSALKLIAYYLPQFHPIPENDEWWGKGFTEWTNVTKATPLFGGHYQPHLPGELGFYDLRIPEVMERQIELAKQYGIHAFCFYYYWFGGKRLLERPLDMFLKHPEWDFPFCVCWANENWTRRWNGGEQDILMAQTHSPEDDLACIEDLARYLRDPRCVRIDGKPVLIVYRVDILPEAAATAQRWREYCRRAGLGEIMLIAAQTFGITDPRPYGFDAAVEFPPHGGRARNITHLVDDLHADFEGAIFDYAGIPEFSPPKSTPYTAYRTVCAPWDNTARRGLAANVYANGSPASYERWLDQVATFTRQHNRPQDQLIFINAWNEWAEGAHLEPDAKWGYAYLNATARVLAKHQSVESPRKAA